MASKFLINKKEYQQFYEILLNAFVIYIYPDGKHEHLSKANSSSIWDEKIPGTDIYHSVHLFGWGTSNRRFFHKYKTLLRENENDPNEEGAIKSQPICKALEFLGCKIVDENTGILLPSEKAKILWKEFKNMYLRKPKLYETDEYLSATLIAKNKNSKNINEVNLVNLMSGIIPKKRFN